MQTIEIGEPVRPEILVLASNGQVAFAA